VPKNNKKYEVIYADPPWRYSFSKSNSRKIENQYPTMTVKEICELEVPSEKNSVLYLWTTTPKLIEGLQVMKAWGFTYKSQAIWDKEVMGMCYWFRGQHEILLVGTKGKFSPPPAPLRKSSVFRFKRSKHSKKPDEIRDLIASWFPDTTKLEMFARMAPKGWDTWGNEIETEVEIQSTEKHEEENDFITNWIIPGLKENEMEVISCEDNTIEVLYKDQKVMIEIIPESSTVNSVKEDVKLKVETKVENKDDFWDE